MIEQKACKYRAKARARDFTHLLAKSGGGSREAVTEQKKCTYRVNARARDCAKSTSKIWRKSAVIEHIKARARDFTHLLAKSVGSESPSNKKLVDAV